MSNSICPVCESEVPAYEICACGYDPHAPVDSVPRSQLLRSPTALYPWLGRALTLLRVMAYLSLVVGCFSGLSTLWDAVLAYAVGRVIGPHLLVALYYFLGTAIAFVLQLGLVDAGMLLQAVHRRVSAVDERDRADG